ncbi:MAG: hypothetical protein IH820_06600 [Bacteroidetes bacterium]|nr:hypothetical protein [Bacteroidota bacterium]
MILHPVSRIAYPTSAIGSLSSARLGKVLMDAPLALTNDVATVNPFLILLLGMAVVIGGILVLRLHAFVALLLGALLVALLTSSEAIVQYALDQGMSAAEAWPAPHKLIQAVC